MNVHTLPREPREIGQFREGYAPLPEPFEALKNSIESIKADPIDSICEIAALVRALPYGEHMKFAAAIGADPDAIWKWATK